MAAIIPLPLSRAAWSRDKPLVFLHLPKTSGTALVGGLTSVVQPRRIVSGFDGSLFGNFEEFETLAPEVRRQIYLEPHEMPNDGDFVSGHFALSTLSARYAGAQFMTVLREPIARLFSHWFFWRAQSAEQLRAWGKWADRVERARAPLPDFLQNREIAAQTDNLYLRMLLWPHPAIPAADFIDAREDDELVRQALARLEPFAFLDVIENPGFSENLAAFLGQPATYERINETAPTADHRWLDQLDAATFTLLEERARLDLRLWQAVAQARAPQANLESWRLRTLMLTAARHAGAA